MVEVTLKAFFTIVRPFHNVTDFSHFTNMVNVHLHVDSVEIVTAVG